MDYLKKFSKTTQKHIEEIIEQEVKKRITQKFVDVKGSKISIEIPVRPRPFNIGTQYKEMKRIFDYVVVNEALERNGGSVSKTARAIGINRNTIHKYKNKWAQND